MNRESKKGITVTVLGRDLELSSLSTVVVEGMGAVRYRDAYGIKSLSGESWLFDYGVLVSWGVSEDERQQLVARLAEVAIEGKGSVPMEQYAWQVAEGETFAVLHDVLTLPNDDTLVKLALSHAFAQSAKVMYFEDLALGVINQTADIPKQLAATGKIPLTRKALSKTRGSLLSTINDINLHFGLLDTPEFFWDYPELESLYLRLAKYLDLQQRIEILGKKLATLQNMLDMLAEEQHHKHAAFLEWIIIILIAVDIAIYFF